jgi:hypothetical protein
MGFAVGRYLRTTAANKGEDIDKATAFADLFSGNAGDAVADAADATVAELTAGSAQIVHDSTTVDSSEGGAAQTANLTNVPANSLLLAVYATVVTPMDGDATTTLEVGVSGNVDNYIDTADFDPSAAAGTDYCNIGGTNNDMKVAEWIDDATQLIATWTNDANATVGSTVIHVVYAPLTTNDLDTQFDAIVADVLDIRTQLNALITSLEGAGYISA